MINDYIYKRLSLILLCLIVFNTKLSISTTDVPDDGESETSVAWLVFEWVLIIILVAFSGLFSGLNLGLMGLDPIGLQIVMASDNAKNRECAKKIQPLRKRGNWLLCTLLIGNVAVNSALSILLADKTSGLVGFFVSTATITIFGEIVPQALCSRYALEIGAKTIWIVWPLMWMMAVVAYPIAFLLDKVLGDELGTVYSNKELQKLVEIHAEIEGTGVSDDTAGMLKGALGLKDALVTNCMTEMKDVFWLNDQSKLSFDVLTEIFKSGHSRIPIFNTQDKFGRIACVGLLYVKDLILLDPDDEMPVTQIMNAFKHKTPPIVWKDDTLQHLLEIFVKTSQHLAFVQDVASNHSSNTIALNSKHTHTVYSKQAKERIVGGVDGIVTSTSSRGLNEEEELDNTYEYVGIITLEDVIEHVLQTQLIDEHDNFVDNKHMLRTNRLNRIDWNMLHIFDHRQRVLTTLPPQELQAVYHFLSQTIKPFTPKNRLVSEASIKNLLATSSVLRVVVSQDEQIVNSKFGRRITENPDTAGQLTQRDPYKDIEDNGLLLYQRDKKTKYFTLLLDGKCEIYAGRQGFRCELTRWSYLCPDALDHSVECYRYNKPLLDYVPDFTAKIIENSRVLRIKLDDFRACLEGKFDFDTKSPNSPISTHMGSLNHSQPISQHHSDSNLHGTTNNVVHDSIFEREPLMHSASEPHLITSLPTPRTISDNSQQNNNNSHKHASFHHHPNPNYRLSQKNNLGSSHIHDNDGRHSPNSPQRNHPHLHNTNSSSGLLGNAYHTNPTSMHTIIEVEDQKTDQNNNSNTSFPYNPQSVEMASKQSKSRSPQPRKQQDDNDDKKYNNDDNNNNSRHVRFKKIQNIDTKAGQIAGVSTKKSNNRKDSNQSTSTVGRNNDDVNGGKSNTIDTNNNNNNDSKERKTSLSYSAQHVYKQKKRTKSSEQPNDKKDDEDQLHLYTTPTTSNVSELMASQQ